MTDVIVEATAIVLWFIHRGLLGIWIDAEFLAREFRATLDQYARLIEDLAMRIKYKATVEGHELGKHLARFCDDAKSLKFPELPPHYNSCAFSARPHLANGSPMTQTDALKCGMEGYEFYCHQPDREGELCAGWAMMMLAKDKPDFVNVPWLLSEKVHDK